MKKSLNLLSIDFNQPWWRVITDQGWVLYTLVTIVFCYQLFWVITPMLIANALEKGTWTAYGMVCGSWFLTELVHVLIRPRLNARFQLQCVHSILYNAHKLLLTIDPRYHTHRSSGTILAKIDRAARGYEDVIDQVLFEFLPLIIGVIAMLGILSTYSFIIACAVGAALLLILGGSYYFAGYACQAWENTVIQTDDAFRATAVENLAQVNMIRATYATDYMHQKLSTNAHTNYLAERNLWMLYSYTARTLTAIYVISILVLLGFLIWQLQHHLITAPFAIGLILAYVQSTKQIVKILQPLRKLMRGYTAITDLFNFMPSMGQQEIPTLGEHTIAIPKNQTITIQANNISFTYSEKKDPIFINHSLVIHATCTQRNKLYGIIGSSGSGKTTLLSILGGQLKPLTGSVLFNGIDMYQIPDSSRRYLVALQGQVATNMRGTLRYNLLFGLPETASYTDADLLNILDRVGLTKVIGHLQGLETMLGEGGLNLSGGQRQRLNFASLYLRAQFYKPQVILIDEPTSSLDEISEREITKMIEELAQHAITLVIAHRLKTLENAVGLIDLSLIAKEKQITPRPPQELLAHSPYYAQLIEGTATIDENWVTPPLANQVETTL